MEQNASLRTGSTLYSSASSGCCGADGSTSYVEISPLGIVLTRKFVYRTRSFCDSTEVLWNAILKLRWRREAVAVYRNPSTGESPYFKLLPMPCAEVALLGCAYAVHRDIAEGVAPSRCLQDLGSSGLDAVYAQPLC